MAVCECSSCGDDGQSPRKSDCRASDMFTDGCDDLDDDEGTDRDGDSDAYSDHEESEESDAFGLPRTGRFSPGGLSTTSTRPRPHSERSAQAPTTAPKRRRRAPRVPKKVAEVVEDTAAASAARPDVSEAVMSRIKKALALGLHCGGNEAEMKHAMLRATRLLQQHGLSQAGAPPLAAPPTDHACAAARPRAGRQGMVRGLYKIAKADKKEREDALDAARAEAAARAARPAAADEPAAKPVLGQRDMNAAASAAAAPNEARSTKHSGGGKNRKGAVRAPDKGNGAWQDFDDVGNDSLRASGRGSTGSADDSTEAGGLVMQQLVLYNDKAKLACETLRKKLHLYKERALNRQIKNYKAYRQGEKDASKVNLGAERIAGRGA
eukprot:jgi/Ulvmu1/8397/UM042_0104.1